MVKKLIPMLFLPLLLGCPSSGPPTTSNPVSFFVHTEFFPVVDGATREARRKPGLFFVNGSR